jgi:hypothetical protein
MRILAGGRRYGRIRYEIEEMSPRPKQHKQTAGITSVQELLEQRCDRRHRIDS